ncbi:MAG: YdeI/OmpD-associated family protein [Phyllobacteriaceae bacterium]|nr:YdeI/OmpD-associated family protein [Phyllobacteriaceae bacterium]
MISEIEDFFEKGCGRCARFATPDCSTRKWSAGLAELRRICLSAGLAETVKWGHPCYMAAGRNIAIIGAFRGDFRLTFFNAALMKDPRSVLERQGENTQHANMISFAGATQVLQSEPVIVSYLQEAIAYAEAGILPEREDSPLELPSELIDALDGDPELAEAFNRLTPGRQKSYVINLASAKKSETRVARILKFRDRILAGKGATEL